LSCTHYGTFNIPAFRLFHEIADDAQSNLFVMRPGEAIWDELPVPIEFNAYDLGYTGVLSWDEAPEKARRNLALIPYVHSSTAKDYETKSPADYDFQVGLDVKVPVSSSLNLDLTVNPDFSQVEVDEQVINLTLFDIRLPEKRVFFLENNEIFKISGSHR